MGLGDVALTKSRLKSSPIVKVPITILPKEIGYNKKNKLGKEFMIQDSEISVNTCATIGRARLQAEVDATIKRYLKIESIRRGLTIGQFLNEIVKVFAANNVSETTS